MFLVHRYNNTWWGVTLYTNTCTECGRNLHKTPNTEKLVMFEGRPKDLEILF